LEDVSTKTEFRPYAGEQDLLRLRVFLMNTRTLGSHMHVGDLVWRLYLVSINFKLEDNIRLYERDGQLQGFALFDPRDTSVLWELALPEMACEDEVLGWAIERYVQRGRPRGRLLTGALRDDAHAIALLERYGFQRAESFYVLNQLSLTGRTEPSNETRGYTVRCMAGEQEHAEHASAHREVFHPSSVTAESYVRLMRLPGYERELDLLAVTPQGQIGAFCLAWVDLVNGVGEFEPVGTRPAYRRRGMARAVLLEGLRRLQARGCETAIVWTDGDNAGGQALYESVGFRPVQRDDDYEYRDH
jgi:ribosomal protein S18 acetylase RimI-like enzyme